MKKSDYTRSTKECNFNELRPKFREYFKKYIKVNNIEESDIEIKYCFETTNLKKGFLGKVQTNYTCICISTNYLFWGIISDKKDTGIAASKWTDISEVWKWEETENAKFVEESGVELYGFIYLWGHRSRWFIGLGNDTAGEKCVQILKEMHNQTKT